MFENCRYCSKMLTNLINDMMDLAKYMAYEKNINLSLKTDEKLYPFIKNINGDEGRYT